MAGVKGPIVASLGAESRFVGGHPMAGSEQDGIDGADPELFVGATWVLTPTEETAPDAYARVSSVISSLGANVVAVPPERHDNLVALVSHVPHLAAATLMNLAADAATEDATLLRLAAGGFRDMTRVAAGQPGIWPDVVTENQEGIAATIDRLIAALVEVRQVVASADRAGLLALLQRARDARVNLPTGAPPPDQATELRVPVPDRPGVIAEVCTLLGGLGVNIFDMEIAHSVEGDRGVLVFVVDAANAAVVRKVLGRAFVPHLAATAGRLRRWGKARPRRRRSSRSRPPPTACEDGCGCRGTSRSRTGRCCWRRSARGRRACAVWRRATTWPAPGMPSPPSVPRWNGQATASWASSADGPVSTNPTSPSTWATRGRRSASSPAGPRPSTGSPSCTATGRSPAGPWNGWSTPLRAMGAGVDGRDGARYPPLVVRGGRLRGIDYRPPVASAQVKAAVLLAGLAAGGETTVREAVATRAHTEELLAATGADISVDAGAVTVRPSAVAPLDLDVPGDPSQAAFWVVAASMVPGSELVVENVYVGTARAGFVAVLRRMGADIRLEAEDERGPHRRPARALPAAHRHRGGRRRGARSDRRDPRAGGGRGHRRRAPPCSPTPVSCGSRSPTASPPSVGSWPRWERRPSLAPTGWPSPGAEASPWPAGRSPPTATIASPWRWPSPAWPPADPYA